MRRFTLALALLVAAGVPGGSRAVIRGAEVPPPRAAGVVRAADAPPPQAAQAPAPAQQPPASGEADTSPRQDQPPAPPVFRTAIDFVRVDVIVTDRKGQPVTDLKPEEVEVFEDGDRQDIESFKLFRVDEITETTPARPIRSLFDEESEAQRPDVRLFAFFLDDYHVRRGNAMRARMDIADFVRRSIAPQDMVGIMYPLTPTSDVVMSRNHEALARAIEQFDGRKYDYFPRNQFEEQYANYPAVVVEQVRNQVSLGALKGLIIKLGGLREGRKALILVSEGYTNYLPPQLRDPVASQPGLGNPARGNESVGDNMGEQRERWFSQAEMLSDLKDVFDLANRNNVSIYALDPRGLAAFEHDVNEAVPFQMDAAMLRQTMDSIRVLADETDGRAIVNRNDLAAGMRQIIRDSSAYYLVGYNSKKAPKDGKFHEIRVRVKRPGVEVRHRKGYWALTLEETARAIAPPKPEVPKDVDAALGALQTRTRNQYISSWMGLSRGSNGKTRVTFVWEPVARSRTGATAAEQAAQVQLTVVGEDGAPHFRGAAPDLSSGNPAVRGPQRLTFEVPPGRIQVKYAIRDSSESTLDTDVRELSIPDLSAPQVGLSTPGIYRARTAPEAQQILKDPNAIPAVAREFRRTERLIIRTQAYGPGTEVPEVSAKLLNRIGTAMQDIPVTLDQQSGQAQIDLPLSGIAPGEYLLDVRASGQGGEAKHLIAFKVVS
jgi:VWFA-related protein